MKVWTEEEFNRYKGAGQFLEVSYYDHVKVMNHKTYEDYVESFNQFYAEEKDSVVIPRELLMHLQERVDIQNEYPVWMMINHVLSGEQQ